MLKRLPTAAAVAAMLLLLTGAMALAASVTEIAQPDEDYVASTTRIEVAHLEDGELVTSVSDGTLTVSFATPMLKQTVPDQWSTWSSPPDAEDGSPALLSSDFENEATLTLSPPAATFGFELQPDGFGLSTWRVEFRLTGGGTHVIERELEGHSGARLVAIHIDQALIEAVHISAVSGSPDGLAIAQMRYALEPQVAGAVDANETSLKDFLEGAITNGALIGAGPGNGAKGRLTGFTAIIEQSEEQRERGNTTAACNQMRAALKQVNGSNPSPSPVAGPASGDLVTLIEASIASNCE